MEKNRFSFFEFSMKQSKLHHQTLIEEKLDEKISRALRKTSTDSLTEQKKIEESDKISFDEFLQNWNGK
jgi:glutamate--cysteine ligase